MPEHHYKDKELAKTVITLLEQYKTKKSLPERCIIAEEIGFVMIDANEKGISVELLIHMLQLQFGSYKSHIVNNAINSCISTLKGSTYTDP